MTQRLPTQHRYGDAYLRAVAILAVVTIHFLAGLDGAIYKTAWYQPFIVSLDQLCRISVPIFVALSGYGLMQKYQTTPFQWSEFLQRRVWKLVPLYVIWSILTFIIFLVIPKWRPDGLPASPIIQILFGKADYHLYFVPMIFQLYLLFPFLMNVFSKWKVRTFFLVLLFQICLYIFYMSRPQTLLPEYPLATDYQQYPWFFTWIFYFVLGMSLPFIHTHMNKRIVSNGVLLFAYVGWAWSCFSGLQAIAHGVDPIIALRFTRISVLLYASASIIWLTWKLSVLNGQFHFLKKIGDFSYWIYLMHTMALRLLFMFF